MGLMLVVRGKDGKIKKDINIDRIEGKKVIEENKLKEEEEKNK